MAKTAKPVVVSAFPLAVSAFAAAILAAAISPYTPIAHSTQEAIEKATEDLVAAAATLQAGEGGGLDANALNAAITAAIEPLRAELVETVLAKAVEKLSAELGEGLDGLRENLANSVKAEVADQLPDLVKAAVAEAAKPPAQA